MMKAVVQERYGQPDVLAFREVERPEPKEGEVLVRVKGSSVNKGDWFLLTGQPLAVRPAFGLFRPKRQIPGMDLAGTVEAVGPGVRRFQPGDDVYGEHQNAYAEYVCVPEARLARKPANLTFEQAASVPVAGVTALQGLRDKGKVGPGSRVLINGASGGVGTFAIQVAKALGAEVTAICSTRNVEQARALGADQVIDYTREDFAKRSERFDTIFDLAGNRSVATFRRLLAPAGVYVSSGGSIGSLLRASIGSLFSRQVVILLIKQSAEDLTTLAGLIESGTIRPVIEKQFTFAELPDALRSFGQGHAQGKCVITV